MIIYLYKKTHLKTGMQYLGQTTSKDPHKYLGSGVYWKNHLKKYGNVYTTTILKECLTKEELKYWGEYYSNLWNIVEDPNWANLKVECGDGGRQSAESRQKISQAGLGRTPWNKNKKGCFTFEQRKKISEANKRRPPQTTETILKRVIKNTGKKRSEEQRARMSEAQRARVYNISEETRKKMSLAKKGKIPWNKGLKGAQVPWNKGKKKIN